LVSPLDDDSLDVVLEGHVALLALRFANSLFLLVDASGTLLEILKKIYF
jgi:hypothetical protein